MSSWKYLFSLCVLSISFVSCNETMDNFSDEAGPYFSSFCLTPELNPGIKDTIHSIIRNDTIYILCPELHVNQNLTPVFTGNYAYCQVGGAKQYSGESSQNFSRVVAYELTGENGKKRTYYVLVKLFNGLPIVRILTENMETVKSKKNYIKAEISIDNSPEHEVIECSGKIKGRGNYSWREYPKKPYKIKFAEKQSPFGFPENKDWVLLAEYCDKSLLRTAYMCEVSKAIGMKYVPRYQHVDLFLNNEYQGAYVLIDQVEKAKSRVDVQKDGYLIEIDSYYYDEPLYFPTSIEIPFSFQNDTRTRYYTFKHPDADDGEIVEGDDNFKYIQSFVYNMESSFYKLLDDSLNTEYTNYIDVESFAKWFLAVELTGNYDPNMFFVMPSKGSKLEMAPLWDAEWSVGLWSLTWGDAPVSLIDDKIAKKIAYFPYLLKSPLFRKEICKVWEEHKDALNNVKVAILQLLPTLIAAQEKNNDRWPLFGNLPNVKFDTREEEVTYMGSYISNRFIWIDFLLRD